MVNTLGKTVKKSQSRPLTTQHMNTNSNEKFRGLWPAIFTPTAGDGNLNVRELEKLLDLLISQNVDGIYLLGSTGQGFLFSESQRKEIAASTVEIVNGRLPVIVQVGALNTNESVRLAKHAAEQGADGISSVGPIYYAASPKMGIEHLSKIARATELPFFPYQIGQSVMNQEMIDQLKKLPNMAGMKLTTSNLVDISNIHNKAGSSWKLFSGADDLLCHAALCGTVGAIGTTYNLLGPVCKHVREAFLNGDTALGTSFMLAMQKFIDAILQDDADWSFFRRAMQLKYSIDIGDPLAPLLPVKLPWTDNEIMNMVDQLEKTGYSKNLS